jgi:hypothetical protein
MAEKNECGKTVPINTPYETWKSYDNSWEWRVLKKYQKPSKERENFYARWFCGVKSPHTYGEFELGDVYVNDIKTYAIKVKEV